MIDIKNELKDIEVKIEQYPMAVSPRLIEEFLIMGYEDTIKKEKIINPIKNEIIKKKNYKEIECLKNYQIYHLPTIINVITTDSSIPLVNSEILITYAFPIPPNVYYCTDNQLCKVEEPEISKIVFNNINNEAVMNGYAYCFYEKEIVNLNENEQENIIFYIPKAFVIISQYNYFYSFHKICEQLHKNFLSDNIEIPLEIQIYNLINFTPCPIDNKFELSVFPFTNLDSIKKCKNFEEYKNLDVKKNYIYLDQLLGYKHSQINFCKIFDILEPNTIIQVYLQLFCAKSICFFSENKEILNLILLAFTHFLFPIAHKENIYCLNPNKYFSEEGGDSIIFGFLTSYIIIEFSDPMRKDPNNPNKKNFYIFEDEKAAEKDRKGFDKKLFKCDFILDIANKSFKMYEAPQNPNANKTIKKKNEEDNEECEEDEDEIEEDNMTLEKKKEEIMKNKTLLEYSNYLLGENFVDDGITLNILIRELLNTLKGLKTLIKEKKLNSFFIENEEEKKISHQIQEAFLRFNVLICNDFFNKYSNYHGQLDYVKMHKQPTDEQRQKMSTEEYFFYDNFQSGFHWDILLNFCKGYSSIEPKFLKSTKRGFENILNLVRENSVSDSNNYKLKGHYIELLDCSFKNKNEVNPIPISFFDFYKYFDDKLKVFISENINEDYIDKKIVNKKDKKNYYYKYKKFNFDEQLLLKYCYYLEELSDQEKKMIFPMSNKIKPIEKIIYTKNYYNSYYDFMIEYEILNLKDIIQFCILNIVVLSTSELKLLHFTEPIYSLIKNMNFFIRKYVELILNVSYREITKKQFNLINEANKYFDIYRIGMEEKKLFPNDELLLLEEKIKEYCKIIEANKDLKSPSEIVNSIKNKEEDNLYKLTFEKKDVDKNKEKYEFEKVKNKGQINEKIIIKSDLLENKEIKKDSIYYPNTLYKKLNELIDKYYPNLDFQSIDKNEYNKLIVDVIYYADYIKDQLPKGIQKFLFYCLCNDKE